MTSPPQAETAETAVQNETDGVGELLARLGHGDEIEIERITPISDRGYLTSIPVEHGLDLKTECQKAFGGGTYLAKCKRRLPDGRYQWIKGSARFTISGHPKAMRSESSAMTPYQAQMAPNADLQGRLLDILSEKLRTPGENLKDVADSILQVVQQGSHPSSDPLDGILKAAETYAKLKVVFEGDKKGRKANPDDEDDEDDEDDKLDDDNIVSTLGGMFIKNMMGGQQQTAAPAPNDAPPGWMRGPDGKWVRDEAPPGWERGPDGKWVAIAHAQPQRPQRAMWDAYGQEMRFDEHEQAWRYQNGAIVKGQIVRDAVDRSRQPPPVSRPNAREEFPQPRRILREVPLQFASSEVEKQEVRNERAPTDHRRAEHVSRPQSAGDEQSDLQEAQDRAGESEIDNRKISSEMQGKGNSPSDFPDIVTNPSQSVRMEGGIAMNSNGITVVCPDCNGTGENTEHPSMTFVCSTCHGKKRLVPSDPGLNDDQAPCEECKGWGSIDGQTCEACGGNGIHSEGDDEEPSCPHCNSCNTSEVVGGDCWECHDCKQTFEPEDDADVKLSEATPEAIADEIANMDPDEQVETLALLGPTFGIDSATMRDLVRQAQAGKAKEGAG